MTNKNFIWAVLGSSITLFILNAFVYNFWSDYLTSNAGISKDLMQMVMKPMDQAVIWAMVVSFLFAGTLLATVNSWAASTTFWSGLKTGAITGLLVAGTIDFGYLGTSNLFSNVSAIGDIIISGATLAISGGVAAWIAGMSKVKVHHTVSHA